MMTPPRLVLAAAVLLGACTPTQWTHASYGTVASAQETAECQQSAWHEAQRQAFFQDFMRPRFLVGRDGRLHYNRFGSFGHHDTFFLERNLFDYCMRARGYRLTPVPEVS